MKSVDNQSKCWFLSIDVDFEHGLGQLWGKRKIKIVQGSTEFQRVWGHIYPSWSVCEFGRTDRWQCTATSLVSIKTNLVWGRFRSFIWFHVIIYYFHFPYFWRCIITLRNMMARTCQRDTLHKRFNSNYFHAEFDVCLFQMTDNLKWKATCHTWSSSLKWQEPSSLLICLLFSFSNRWLEIFAL